MLELLNGPRGLVVVLLIAAALALPSLGVGFFLDDYAHLAALDGISPVARPWNVYCFAPGDPEKMAQIIEEGPFPWFTRLDIRVQFFRPLSSATMRLDRWLFGDVAWPYHLHSILWYLAVVAAVGTLLRRVLPGSMGMLALLLFAVAATHWFPVAWWSHRNALVSCALGFGGLLAYVRWRETQWRPGAWLALGGFGLGLLAGETAFSISAYIVAYELFAAPGSATRRIGVLAPVSMLAVLYLLLYSGSGYGVQGTGCYINPMREPLVFLAAAPQRFLIMAANQFFLWPAEIPALIPQMAWPSAAIGIAALVVVVLALRAAWRHLAPEERRSSRWLMIGGLMSIVPFLAPFTSGRLLMVSSLGGSVAIAIIIREGRRACSPRALHTLARILIAIHLILAPLAWLLLSPAFARLNSHVTRLSESVEIDDDRVASQQVMLLSVPDPAIGIYASAMRMHNGHPKPAAWRPLSVSPCDSIFTRTASNAFELALDGEMLKTLPEQIARDAAAKLEPGDRLEFDSFGVTVLDVGKIGPKRIAFHFAKPLEDPAYVWLEWREGRLRPFKPPPEGQSVRLKWTGPFRRDTGS
ncbi:MAG TPA: hypothetical protein P5318_15170 [Candidatus Hydrogenedentes bacterium]|nr:hypothetical protein [Candidatus Hydrogenedentota bacterium]HPC17570.1 hypothetical protein [Candidatus Hydrogenedentota bacterium]HRT21455.1 hypothetical protein [Candidatus Hydrogenedentota bacterium]HRT63942.1 hypothetical protein [Candidatus Hydrogenedentota bacterium]